MKIRKVLPLIIYGLFFIILVLAVVFKKNMTSSISSLIVAEATPGVINRGERIVDSLYNYTDTDSAYRITFLEFGAGTCSACRRMVKVLDEIRNSRSDVNVVYINVLQPENNTMMQYFGIAAIPTQVLLDRRGKEYFRHTGYYSADQLNIQFNE